MDKYEFKHLLEDIKSLTDQQKYADAAAVADKIDWRRVKNIVTLREISDLYKINRRYEDARDILLLAYDRKPQDKQICSALCEMYCKTGEPVEAAEFYKEFEKLAPRDAGRYILKYKLYDAFDASIDEKIEVLEKLKEVEYKEKWMYELAKLYDKRGLATKCVETCDELILWFGFGKYVTMAMELKMVYEPLTPEQQQIYDNRFQTSNQETYQNGSDGMQGNGYAAYEQSANEDQASDMQEDAAYGQQTMDYQEENYAGVESAVDQDAESAGSTRTFDVEEVRRQLKEQAVQYQAEASPAEKPSDDIDIQIKTVDVGSFNTMNLQEEIAKGLQEVLREEEQTSDESDGGALREEEQEEYLPQANDQVTDTKDMRIQEDNQEPQEEAVQMTFEDMINRQVMADMRRESMDSLEKEAMIAQPPEPMAQVLTQESDGQIRLVVPEKKRLEKQITGQMSIEDVRAEWERMKQENKAKQEEEFRQQVLRNTGQMFTKYEAEVRDSILKKMEESNEFLVNAPNMELPENYETQQEDHSDKDDFDMDTLEDERDVFDAAEEDTAEKSQAASESAAEAEKESVEETVAEDEWESVKEAEAETKEESAKEAEAEQESAKEAEAEDEWESVKEAEGESKEESAEEAEAEVKQQSAKEAEPEIEWESVEEAAEVVPSSDETERYYTDFAQEDVVMQDIAPASNEADKDTQKDQELAEKARQILEEDKARDAMDFSWEDEDTWGDETDLDFEDTEKATSESETAEQNVNDSELNDSETTEQADELEDTYDAAEEPEEGNIDFESLPQEEEFSYSTEADGQDEDMQDDFRVSFDESSEDEDQPEDMDQETDQDEEHAEDAPVRDMSKEEEAIYGSIVQGKAAKEQLVRVVDTISMAPYTGNVVITGEADMNTLDLAKKIICEVKTSDSNFVGTVAKISGKALSGRDMQELLNGLKNGALIIEKPSQMSDQSAKDLYKMLQRDDWGIIVFLLDSRKGINSFFGKYEELKPMFNAHMHLKPLSEEALAQYAKQYAYANEYSIDSMGLLALHTRIDELQTAKHAATYEDVVEIMDDAIYSASRLTFGHFVDILFGRRYDEEDMIIITEKDFR